MTGDGGEFEPNVDGRDMTWPPITRIDAAPAPAAPVSGERAVTRPGPVDHCGLNTPGGQLAVFAPRDFQTPIRRTFETSEIDVVVEEGSRVDIDPDGRVTSGPPLDERIARSSADAALVVVPRECSYRDAVSGPVIGKLPTGIIRAESPTQLAPVLRSFRRLPRPEWAVFAMGTDIYLEAGEKVLDRVRPAADASDGIRTLQDRRAHRCSRQERSIAVNNASAVFERNDATHSGYHAAAGETSRRSSMCRMTAAVVFTAS